MHLYVGFLYGVVRRDEYWLMIINEIKKGFPKKNSFSDKIPVFIVDIHHNLDKFDSRKFLPQNK